MSNADPRASGATYRMLRELGGRAQHSYAAIREPHELLVVQRFVRATAVADAGALAAGDSAEPRATLLDAVSMALLLRDARCLAKSCHPNIGRVRYVDLVGVELTIATEMLDGATLAELFAMAAEGRTSPGEPPLPLPVLVRILLDVLGGLGALHALRDGMNAPLGAIHGELCPPNIVVGTDGVARIIDVLRPRPVTLTRASHAVAYAAPEALVAGGTDDPRADLYAVGAILWEALAARRLFDETEPALVRARQRDGEIASPPIHPKSPFAKLADVAMRALALDPTQRFADAAEMAAALRKVAGARLALGSTVAGAVGDLAGERIRTRRGLLDPATSGTQRRASASVPAPRRSATVQASPRVPAPTVAAEVPESLLAASRPSAPDEFVVDDSDDELPGPRGSSPDLDVDPAQLAAAFAASEARQADATERGTAETCRAVSPLAGNVPLPSRPDALPAHRAPSHSANETPGELVVPILPAAAAARTNAQPRSRGVLALMVVVVVIASGASMALRMHGRGAAGPAAATAPAEPPPAAAEALPSRVEIAATTAAAPLSPTRPTHTPMPSATAPRLAVPAPVAPPAQKAKKSVYDPSSL